MTKGERLAAVFVVAFAIIYAPTMDYNWTFATYHPIQGIWQMGRAPPLGGGYPLRLAAGRPRPDRRRYFRRFTPGSRRGSVAVQRLQRPSTTQRS